MVKKCQTQIIIVFFTSLNMCGRDLPHMDPWGPSRAPRPSVWEPLTCEAAVRRPAADRASSSVTLSRAASSNSPVRTTCCKTQLCLPSVNYTCAVFMLWLTSNVKSFSTQNHCVCASPVHLPDSPLTL